MGSAVHAGCWAALHLLDLVVAPLVSHAPGARLESGNADRAELQQPRVGAAPRVLVHLPRDLPSGQHLRLRRVTRGLAFIPNMEGGAARVEAARPATVGWVASIRRIEC